MNEQNWQHLDEAEFDLALRQSLSEPPPEDIVRGVTPWREAMDRILVGLALNAVTLDFLCLNYILPAIGLLLMLLGFRSLRQENIWFRSCFVLAVVKSLCYFPFLILNATIYQGAVYDLFPYNYFIAGSFVLTSVQLVCLWGGFKAIKTGVGLPAKAGAVAALIVWYLVLMGLVLLGIGGILAGIAMIGAYILIILGLDQLSTELDEVGYAVKPAPVRISDTILIRAIVGVVALAIVCGYLFGNSYRLEWAPVETAESAEVANIRAELLALGFPGDVLNDLTNQEILSCAGALQVVTDVSDVPLNSGREVAQYEGALKYITTVYDVKELRCTGVAVELPGERETWRVFHHFRWLLGPDFRGTESVQLWPAFQNNEGWDAGGDVTGRILCTREGKDYVAPYAFLGDRIYTTNGIFWEPQTATAVFAEFSLPASGENQRGYVAYTAVAHYTDTKYILSSCINYTHQASWLQYPVQTAAEHRMTAEWGNTITFRTARDDLQFYNTDDGIELLADY